MQNNPSTTINQLLFHKLIKMNFTQQVLWPRLTICMCFMPKSFSKQDQFVRQIQEDTAIHNMTQYGIYCRSKGCSHSFIHQSSSCSHHSVLESFSLIELMVTMVTSKNKFSVSQCFKVAVHLVVWHIRQTSRLPLGVIIFVH